MNYEATATVSVLVDGIFEKGRYTQGIIPFKVVIEGSFYRAIPMVGAEQRADAGLPEVISFSFVDHCIVSGKATGVKMIDIIKSILQELMIQELI